MNIIYYIKEKIKKIGVEWDEKAPSEENAIEFAHQHINPEPDKMIDSNHFTMEYLLAHSGESINKRFRNDKTDTLDNEIVKMVSEHTTDTDLVLYRGICSYVYELMCDNAQGMNCDFYEKGFLATSLVKGHELKSDVNMRIYVPAGTHVVYLGNVNDEQGFYEVDIQHGAKLKIESMDNEYINCRLIETK